MPTSIVWRWEPAGQQLLAAVKGTGTHIYLSSPPTPPPPTTTDISTNQLIVDIQRNPDATAAAAANSAAGPSASAAALSRATSSANAYTASAAAALAARRLPGQVWTAHVHKAARLNVVGRRRSPAHSEEEGEEGEDGDWSPTARLGGRGGRGSGGPLPLRRRLEVLPPKAHLSVALAGTSSNSDEVRCGRGWGVVVGWPGEDVKEMAGTNHSPRPPPMTPSFYPTHCTLQDSSCVVYTAEQTRRFDALVDVAARVIEPQPPAADA